MNYNIPFSIVFLFLLSLMSCTSQNRKISLIINNSTVLNLSALECFSCKNYFLDESVSELRILSFDKDAVFINKRSDGSIEEWYSVLTIRPHTNDSLWMNVEVFRIFQELDTLRILNLGGRTIANNKDAIDSIKIYLCRALNK